MTTDFDPRTGQERPEGVLVPNRSTLPPTTQASTQNQSIGTRLAIWILTLGLAAGALIGAFAGGIAFERNVLAGSDGPSDSPLTIFDVAWQTVQNNYVEETAINDDKMLEGAIEGMLATLGDVGHTRYLTAEETELDRQSSRGVYQGVGIQVREDEVDGSDRDEGLPEFTGERRWR